MTTYHLWFGDDVMQRPWASAASLEGLVAALEGAARNVLQMHDLTNVVKAEAGDGLRDLTDVEVDEYTDRLADLFGRLMSEACLAPEGCTPVPAPSWRQQLRRGRS